MAASHGWKHQWPVRPTYGADILSRVLEALICLDSRVDAWFQQGPLTRSRYGVQYRCGYQKHRVRPSALQVESNGQMHSPDWIRSCGAGFVKKRMFASAPRLSPGAARFHHASGRAGYLSPRSGRRSTPQAQRWRGLCGKRPRQTVCSIKGDVLKTVSDE